MKSTIKNKHNMTDRYIQITQIWSLSQEWNLDIFVSAHAKTLFLRIHLGLLHIQLFFLLLCSKELFVNQSNFAFFTQHHLIIDISVTSWKTNEINKNTMKRVSTNGPIIAE